MEGSLEAFVIADFYEEVKSLVVDETKSYAA